MTIGERIERVQTTVTPREFKERLDAGRIPFLLDLRNSDEFHAWRIEGRSAIEMLNIPLEEFVGEEERHLPRLPRNVPIVTFCAHGDAARYAADALREHGLTAVALEGGMDRWSEYYEHHPACAAPAVHQVYRVAKGCICYLAVSGGSAVAIDAPRHVANLIDLAAELRVTIGHVLDTHLHADHVSGGRELAQLTGATYHVHPLDVRGAAFAFSPLTNGGEIAFGSSSIRVIHSPGHTPGSSSFLLDGACLFSGDIIMKESMGRPDLGGMSEEWARELHTTLFSRFAPLGDEVIVLPAHATGIHEQDSSGVVSLRLGQARQSDLYRTRDLSAFLQRVRESIPENPARYQDIRNVNLGLLQADGAKQKELEIGKNLCGMNRKR